MENKDKTAAGLEEKKATEEAGSEAILKGILSKITGSLITGRRIRLILAANWTSEQEKYKNAIRQGREIAIIKKIVGDKAQYQIFYKNTENGTIATTPIDCDEPLITALNDLNVDLSQGSKILTKAHNQDTKTEKVYQLVSAAVTAAHGQPPEPAGRFEFLGILLEQIFGFFMKLVPVIKEVAVPMIHNLTEMMTPAPKGAKDAEASMDVVKHLVDDGKLVEANTQLKHAELELIGNTEKALQECNHYETQDNTLKETIKAYHEQLETLKKDLRELIVADNDAQKTSLVEDLKRVQQALNDLNAKITNQGLILENTPGLFVKGTKAIVEGHELVHQKMHLIVPS